MVWKIFRDLEVLRDQMNEMLGPRGQVRPSGARGWLPPVNVYETPEEYVVVSEVPGADRDKFDVSLTAGHLSIRGEIADPSQNGTLLRSERGRGPFGRVITLTEHVDPNQVHASYDRGVLTVRVGKTAAARPRQIEVKLS